ncbi:MAG: type IV pilus secretin PilQ [Deltaproteobacteria bacterium]|nr:type IV pilus secretin PilQ [Deltaproteobacteria bacterium]MBK8717565.1 type IV pilus secretin PilQ [Deltaproteobacteria bacterium]MBP7285827.1 type IV pilus secretin PilQ [Nannocystaceae bacterium]
MALLLALRPDLATAATLDAPGGLPLAELAQTVGMPPLVPLWAAPGNRIDGLTVDEQDEGTTTLRLRGSAKPTFSVYRMQDPDRLVVDIAASERGKVVPHLPLDNWACGRLSIDDVQEQDAQLVRLVVELKRDVSYIVVPDGDELVVTITPRQVPPEAYFARKSASARRAELEAQAAAVERLRADASARSKAADGKSRKAQQELADAESRLDAARAAEARAKAAEAEARSAKLQARRGVDAGDGNRRKARRALKDAEQQLAKAEQVRAAAEASSHKADRALAKMRAELEGERKAMLAARRRAEQHEADAHRTLADAEQQASHKLADADAQATHKLAAADAQAKALAGAAQRKLADASKQALATESAARRKLADAKRSHDEAAKVEGAARARLAAAAAAAKVAERDAEALRSKASAADSRAQSKLSEAEAKLAEAERKRATAKHELASAEQASQQAQQRLDAAEQAAAQKLAAAEQVRAQAERDGLAAAAARAEADRSREKAKADLASADRTKADADRTMAAAASVKAEAARTKAEADEAKAEADRVLASAKAAAKARLEAAERMADATLADAERKAAKAAAAKLESATKDADAVVAAARKKSDALIAERMKSAESTAAAKIAAAERKARELAAQQLADAEAQAERKLAAARKEAKRRAEDEVAQARKAAVAAAERELASLRARAEKETAAQVAAAREKAEREASADLLAARTKAEREAATQLDGAKQRASEIERTAARKLAAADETLARLTREREGIEADREAARKAKAEALALREQADAALVKARAAMDDATREKQTAIDDRKLADRELTAAKAEASRARKRGELTEQMSQRVAEAERARDAARARQKQAEQDLAKLADDREKLQAKLVAERRTAETMAATITKREQELAKAADAVAQARAQVDALGKHVSPEMLAAAQGETRKVQATATVLEKQVARLRGESDEARTRAAAAERKLAELEEQGARRRKLDAARDEAEAAKREAASSKAEFARMHERLAGVQKDLATRKAEVDQLVARRAELESQGEALRSKNAAASQELAQAEQKLAAVNDALAAERAKLGGVEDEVRKAQAKLDARVEAIAARDRAPAPPAAPARLVESSAPREPAVATATPKRSEAAGASAKVRDVRFEDDRDESRVIISFEGPLAYAGNSLTPTIQVLQLQHAKIPKALERSLDATAYDGPIKLVTSFAEGDGAKVVVSTGKASKARLEEQPGALVWHFPRARRGKATEAVSLAGTKVAAASAGAQAATLATTTTSAIAPSARPPVAAMAPAGNNGAPSFSDDEVMDSRPTRSRGRWRGERITIELQDAPIKDVLLLFSDIGHVNIIAGKGVEGSVTMKLNSVPWDQALDIILRSLTLGSTRDGNVIRVATVEDLENERRAAIERAAARVQQKPLETKLVPVSYATVDEMVPKVQSVLSPRGTVTPDTRTNTLIIMDVAENIALAENLVGQLDTQTPQVLIEARIVEARTTFARNLGVQWGFDFIASPGTGNPTGLLFPNSVGVGGGATGRPVDSRGLILPGAAANPNYAVDLPIPVGTGTGGAIGFSFGSISGNLNTNLRLSASESTGEIRIISAPKIVTLDNSEAQIEQGVQIPISQVSAQGVNTRFVRATLGLKVTPHVTNEGAVLLDVVVEKNEADFVNTGARGDPTILTKQAQSRMLINDNDTAVIGGIYTRSKAVNFDKIPWIADVPIIGWFFKQKAEADQRSEVLIFLTPKIVNRASSIGG